MFTKWPHNSWGADARQSQVCFTTPLTC